MLTYNLSCLYAYSLSVKEGVDDEDEGGAHPFMLEIALHRVVAVLSGVIWGLIITRMIWPISATQKFKGSCSLFLFFLYQAVWRDARHDEHPKRASQLQNMFKYV